MENEENVILLESKYGVNIELVLINYEVDEFIVTSDEHDFVGMYFRGDDAGLEAFAFYFKEQYKKGLRERLKVKHND